MSKNRWTKMSSDITLGVSEFVEYINQALEVAFSFVAIEGEISNFRISRGKWVYFDLKDDSAIVRCFTTVYALSGPFEDGMVVKVQGSPRLHPLYNFTFNVQSIIPVGEGNLRKQADLIRAKLELEGLFDSARKRTITEYPRHIALITAGQSAAYADFIKIARGRWGGLSIDHYDVLVQGDQAPNLIVRALQQVNAQSDIPEAVVIVRGGGSAEDLAAFNDERVVRAIAASRAPTVIAIGHEIDLSLAELAADLHASTPSNAAELLLPDKKAEKRQLKSLHHELDILLNTFIIQMRQRLKTTYNGLNSSIDQKIKDYNAQISAIKPLLSALDPRRPLNIGFTLVRDSQGKVVKSADVLTNEKVIQIEFRDGFVDSQVKGVHLKRGKI